MATNVSVGTPLHNIQPHHTPQQTEEKSQTQHIHQTERLMVIA